MNIVFPEFNHPSVQEALKLVSSINALPADDLATACAMVKAGQADALIAGIEYSSRDVILACRDAFPMTGQTFSGLAVMRPPLSIPASATDHPHAHQTYLLADMAACKHPTVDQLAEIVRQTHASAKKLLEDQPRLALLSFSTLGSGGRDDTISLLKSVKSLLAETNPEILLDGEMQLDAAINPRVAEAKCPDSPVAGHTNVLIAPDLNSGNLIYKTFEQIAGFTVAGPILQGFAFPVSDLSRGSTPTDIAFTIECVARLAD